MLKYFIGFLLLLVFPYSEKNSQQHILTSIATSSPPPKGPSVTFSNLGHHFHSLMPRKYFTNKKPPLPPTHHMNDADKPRNLTRKVAMISLNNLSASKDLVRTVHYPQDGGLTLLDGGNRYFETVKRPKTCRRLINQQGIIILTEYSVIPIAIVDFYNHCYWCPYFRGYKDLWLCNIQITLHHCQL